MKKKNFKTFLVFGAKSNKEMKKLVKMCDAFSRIDLNKKHKGIEITHF